MAGALSAGLRAVSEWIVGGRGRLAVPFCLIFAWCACDSTERVRSTHADAGDAGGGGGSDTGADAGQVPIWLAYVTADPNTPELLVVDVAAPDKPPLLLLQGAVELSWTKDGRWLSAELDQKQSALIDFTLAQPGPATLLELAGARAHGCVPAPSSKRLACVLGEGAAQAPALVDLTGTKPVVTQVAGATFPAGSSPFAGWSPDSRYALYLALNSASAFQLVVVDSDAEGSAATLVSTSALGLAVSPDSKHLAYSEQTPSPRLLIRDLATGGTAQVSAESPSQGAFAWTTQGTALVYMSASALLSHAPAIAQSVVVHPGPVGNLMVSPDGTRAVFEAWSEPGVVLLDAQFFPPQKAGTLPGAPFCWSSPGRYLAVFTAPFLSLVDLDAPMAPAKRLSPGNLAPNGCKFQGETGVTWFSFVNPVIGVAKGPAWEGAELVAAPGGFATPSFSWTSDLERLAFRDLDGSQLQLAEHFPAPVVTTLTSEAVSSFAFRP